MNSPGSNEGESSSENHLGSDLKVFDFVALDSRSVCLTLGRIQIVHVKGIHRMKTFFLSRAIFMANTISKVTILATALIVVVSAVWQAFRTGCEPVAQYTACRLGQYFYWGWFYDYQTLITGLLALAGAWWGVRAINMQMTQEARAEADRLASRRAAARATLPLSLSLLSEYAEECVVVLNDLLEKCVDDALPNSARFTFPAPPAEAIQSFKEMTEVSLPSDRETLAAILTKIQIQRSRISSITPQKRSPHMIVARANLEEYVLDAAEIYARSAALYEYARRKSEAIPPSTISVDAQIAALNNLGIFDDLRDRLVETLRRRNPDG
ncbi:MAG: hypothetical protein EOS36_15455 [Mesorhizobium sp.]|uniref:hypothetical protein n=1 Tax=Mesorhizobium sp. TaxID=1871066 RepID=UPI000FE67B81|nr:hypothetical protein [Mesorhizobium sp.]RWD62317.1 MAG: hypothetical protein EOS36_15455 [Mesorhizobium sp.]RWE46910.1 MAG: hypothetical protein EOS79_11070 [Mesorhizobium sp.]